MKFVVPHRSKIKFLYCLQLQRDYKFVGFFENFYTVFVSYFYYKIIKERSGVDLNRDLPIAEPTPLPTELLRSSCYKTSQIDIYTNGSDILFPFVVISLLYILL